VDIGLILLRQSATLKLPTYHCYGCCHYTINRELKSFYMFFTDISMQVLCSEVNNKAGK